MGWRHRVGLKWILLGLVLLAINGGLILFARLMYPVKGCTGADFWRAVCRVHVGPSDKWEAGGTLHPRRDGYCIYGDTGFHQEFLYRVPETEVLALFPRVREALDRKLEKREAPTFILDAYREWKAHATDKSDAWGLLDAIHAQSLEHWRRDSAHMYRYILQEDKDFDARWEHIRRYPLNIAFEFVFLNALVVFAFWPWLRNLKAWRGIAHIALVPLLLLLPCFLGYASWSFTSIGPSGGVLYPCLIFWFRAVHVDIGLAHAVDRIVWIYLPKPLEWISQPTGPWLSISGGAGGIALPVILLALVACVLSALLPRATLNRRRIMRVGIIGLIACATLAGAVYLLRLRLPVAFALVEEGADSDVCAILRTRPGLAHQRALGGVTLLHYAANCGSEKVVSLLLKEGAPVNARDDIGLTPLHYSSRQHNEKVAELLITYGADAGSRDSFGRTPLHEAAEESEEITRLLLAHGADAQAKDTDGRTPLHGACSKAVAEALLDAGADVNARDKWGDTPLLKGRVIGHDGMAEFLVARGADVNARATDGLTPLHVAAQSSNVPIQEVLLANGAEVNARTRDGFTPLGLVPLHDDDKNSATLMEHGGVR